MKLMQNLLQTNYIVLSAFAIKRIQEKQRNNENELFVRRTHVFSCLNYHHYSHFPPCKITLRTVTV